MAKKPRRRIRYITQGRSLIAQVEQRSGFRWLPTNVREVIDLDRAAAAMRVYDQRKGSSTSGIYDDFTGGFVEFEDSTAGAGIYDGPSLYADTSGFGDRFKRFAKKIAKSKVGKIIKKVHVMPLKIAHKITHGKNSPIRKAEMALQRYVGKALPFTKPFIKVHNQLAKQTHSVVDKVTGSKKKKTPKAAPKDMVDLVETTRRLQAAAISKILKKVPKKHKVAVKKKLIQKATTWAVKSPQTGLTYNFKLN